MDYKCFYHSDRKATFLMVGIKHVAMIGPIPECDECAESDRSTGLQVEPIGSVPDSLLKQIIEKAGQVGNRQAAERKEQEEKEKPIASQ